MHGDLMPGIEQALTGSEGAAEAPEIPQEEAPPAVLASVERELSSVIALRQATQRRARGLEKR